MTSKQYLKQAYRLNELIDSDLAELSRLRELATSISGADFSQDRVQNGNKPGSKIENIVAKIIDLEAAINDEIDKFVDLKVAIRKGIKTVENRNEELLLRLRYIEFLSWDDIQARMTCGERQVHNIHARALKNFKIPG